MERLTLYCIFTAYSCIYRYESVYLHHNTLIMEKMDKHFIVDNNNRYAVGFSGLAKYLFKSRSTIQKWKESGILDGCYFQSEPKRTIIFDLNEVDRLKLQPHHLDV